MKLSQSLQEFLLNTTHKFGSNWWFREGGGKIKVYMRRGPRMIHGFRYVRCIDLSSVSSRYQGKGHFTAFLTALENFIDLHGIGPLYVENVLTDRFAKFFESRDKYQRIKSDNLMPCFVRTVDYIPLPEKKWTALKPMWAYRSMDNPPEFHCYEDESAARMKWCEFGASERILQVEIRILE